MRSTCFLVSGGQHRLGTRYGKQRCHSDDNVGVVASPSESGAVTLLHLEGYKKRPLMKMPDFSEHPEFRWEAKEGAAMMPHGALYLRGERVLANCTRFAARCFMAGWILALEERSGAKENNARNPDGTPYVVGSSGVGSPAKGEPDAS